MKKSFLISNLIILYFIFIFQVSWVYAQDQSKNLVNQTNLIDLGLAYFRLVMFQEAV